MAKLKTLIAKNPSEARGIRKALRWAGVKVDFKPFRKPKRNKKRNPKRKPRRTSGKSRY